MASTNKPNGLTLTRDGGLKFVVSWKVTDGDYAEGQQARIRLKRKNGKFTEWQTADVASNFTSKSFSFTAADFNPTKKSQQIDYIEANVRGKRARTTSNNKTTIYDWSAWATKTLSISVPNRPTAEVELTESNESEFSWVVETTTSDARPFVHTKYQSILKRACKEKNGSKLAWVESNPGWAENTGSDTGTISFTEQPERLAADSYTRWVRFMARGAGGDSAWRYAYHTYARPYKAIISSAKAVEESTTTRVTVKWKAAADFAHPIDQVRIEYAIATPAAGYSCPSGNIWSTGTTVRDASGKDSAQFVINDQVDVDQCLFVRVVTVHDANETASDPVNAKKGALTAPTITSVTVDSSTHRATVVASNGSSVTDSMLAVIFRTRGVNTIVGIIAHGQTTVTVQCPDWGNRDIAFGVKAFQGSYSSQTSADGLTVYTLQKNMQSANVWRSGDVPYQASNLVATAAPDAVGEVILTWDWDWTDANQAEISWSTNPNAWESTDQPETYTISNIYAARWRVAGLETGRTWYFAVRLASVTDDGNATYGDYSDVVSVNLSSAPNVPILALSAAVVPRSGSIEATWDYFSTDGTEQAYAEVFTATVSGSTITVGDLVGSAETARHAEISAAEWEAGETYYLMVRVTSASGMVSAWSDPVPVFVAEDLACTIDSTSLQIVTVPDGDGGSRIVPGLTELPFTATITGAGAGGTTTLIIERAEEYPMLRPDESTRGGYDGETIALVRQTGEGQISINKTDLIGTLDDGAKYRMIAIVEDGYGQSDTQPVPFEVHWAHQAGIPSATVVMQDDVAVITPAAPSTYVAGDTCDIYRLSVDKPQLIVSGASFGTAYVDPYPAVGEHAGYRCVCVTANGDYITEDNQLAWVDVVGELISNATGFINFNGNTLPIQYNATVDNGWRKDFKETKYLGGTVRGVWNAAISRNGNVTAVVPTADTETIQLIRRLADWNGICHVRTQDGSSFAANVEVTNAQEGYDSAGKIERLTLNITRVQPEMLDGMPLSEWTVS